MSKSMGEALLTGELVVFVAKDRTTRVVCPKGKEEEALYLLEQTGDIELVRPEVACAPKKEPGKEPGPLCLPKKGPIPKSIEEAIDTLYDAARQAVDHVGMANYQERQNEAMCWIEDAHDALQHCLNVYRHPAATEWDWLGDFDEENGKYQRKCIECGHEFIGNKRRSICHKCAFGL